MPDGAPPPARTPERYWATLLAVVAVLAAVAAAYFPALRAGFIWDDDFYITENPIIADPDGLAKVWSSLTATPQFYPLVFTTFWIEHRLWGLAPLGYHAVNIVLHAINALLVWRLLRRLAVPGAFVAAMVFAVHPVHVESVAWVTERKNTLSALFYLSSFAVYLKFAAVGLPAQESHPAPRRWSLYAISFLLFAAALLSKTVTCSLPAALLLVLWWKRDRISWRDAFPLALFFALGLLAARTTTWVEQHHVLVKDLNLGLSPSGRVLVASRAASFYLQKLAWPDSLTFIYPRWTVDPAIWWQWVYPAAGAAIILTLWVLRRRLGKGPLTAALYFCGTLVPALGFIDVYPMRYSFVADHFQYLASLGFIALASAALARLIDPPAPASEHAPPAGALNLRLAGAAILLAVPLGSLTYRQCSIYHDIETLWRDTIAKNPSAWMAHNNLAGLLLKQNRVDEAQQHLLKAVELNPSHGESLNNLAILFLNRGEPERALEFARRAVTAEPRKAEMHMTGAQALLATGRYEESADWSRSAIRLAPEIPRSYALLAAASLKLERYADTLAALQQAMSLGTPDPGTIGALGDALAGVGRDDEALAAYDRALAIDPRTCNARCGKATLLARRGQTEQAAALAQSTLALCPTADAYTVLGTILLAQPGRLADASHHLENAVRLDPDSRPAHTSLGRAYSAQDRTQDAVRQFREALRIRPGNAEATALLEAELKRASPDSPPQGPP